MTVDELRAEAYKLGYHIVPNRSTATKKNKGRYCKECKWLDIKGEKRVIGYECLCDHKHFYNNTTAHWKYPYTPACSCFEEVNADDE